MRLTAIVLLCNPRRTGTHFPLRWNSELTLSFAQREQTNVAKAVLRRLLRELTERDLNLDAHLL